MLRSTLCRIALAVSCLIGFSIPAFAQTSPDGATSTVTLSGLVSDPAGQPAADVSVTVVELRRGTLTGSDGRYAISHLPVGTYTISFQRLGFAPEARRVSLTAAGQAVDVTLRVSLIELPGLQVSASAHPTSPLTSPQPTSVLGGAELRTSQAPSLGATIEQLPGLRNWGTGSSVGKPVIRGMRSDRVLITSDGQRLENQGWGDEHGPDVETADIDRIEVIRGPASVLYGSDALGGVVNLISRPLPTAFGRSAFVGGRASVGYGTNHQMVEGGMSFEGASAGLGFRGSWHGRKSDDLETPDGALFNSGGRDGTAAGSLGYRSSWGSVEGRFSHRHETIELHEDPAEDPTATPFQKVQEDIGRLGTILPIGDRTRVEANVGYERNRRREFEEESATDVALGLLSKSMTGEVRLHHPPLGRVEGLVGVSALRNTFEKFGEETLIPNSEAINLAAYFFEQLEQGPWHLSLGGRYDHRNLDVEDDADLGVTAQTRKYDAVTGNAGVLYRLGEPTAIVLNVGRGWRAPSNFDLFANGVHEGTIAFERGNPNLDVEQSLNADLAFRVESSRVRAEVSGFVNRIESFIYSRPTGTFDPGSGFEIFDVVQGDARLAGAEISAQIHPNQHLHLHAGADYVRGENTTTDSPLPWIPPFRATYGARFEADPIGALKEPYLGIAGESNARQDRLDPADTTVPAYTVARLDTGFELGFGDRTVNVDVSARNLFDKRYADFLSRYKTYALAPGRNILFRVSTAF